MSGGYHAGMHGADAMDEDGALPSSVPTQAPDLNFDADITPEEMQMMASMGIPFGFDTTQVNTDSNQFQCPPQEDTHAELQQLWLPCTSPFCSDNKGIKAMRIHRDWLGGDLGHEGQGNADVRSDGCLISL